MLLVLAMMRGVRVALVAVLIFSIAYVLISPDPTDDVYGVLRPNHSANAQRIVIVSLPLPQSPILAVVLFLLSMTRSATQRLTASELFDCVSRC